MTTKQTSLAVQEQASLAKTPMDLLELAIQREGSIDVIERLAKLQREERDYAARVNFDEALNACQAQIGRIAPNQKRENNIMWADYAQLDRAVRPIYIAAGFSIGFSEAESKDPTRLRMCATLSTRGISREFFADISRNPANGKMNQLDADASAASRVKRYLLLDIFNIAVGIDKDEKAAFENAATEKQEADLQDYADSLRQCEDLPRLKSVFADAYKFAGNVSAHAKSQMTSVYNECKARLQ